MLEEGLNRPVDHVFEWLSAEPLAAASLGQVYKAKLKKQYGSGEVAVKVQRPGVLEAVALDLFVMRRAALIVSKIPKVCECGCLGRHKARQGKPPAARAGLTGVGRDFLSSAPPTSASSCRTDG